MKLTMRDQDNIDKGKALGREEGRVEGRAEGRAESILTILSLRWIVPDSLKTEILEQKNTDILDKWLRFALPAQSLAEFRDKMKTV